MLYLTLFIGLAGAFYLQDKMKAAKLYTIFLTILAAFRYGIGADYFAYEFLYKQLKPFVIPEILFGTEKQEVGFRALGSFIKTFGLSYQTYVAILAAITLYYIYRICVRYSKNPMLSMVIYYAFFYFVWVYSGLRQGLAMSVGAFYLLEALRSDTIEKRKEFYKASILLLTIHTSSIIFMVFYVLVRFIPWNRKWMMLTIAASILFAFIPLGNLVEMLSEKIPFLLRLSYYLDDAFTLKELFSIQVLARLGLLSIVLYYYNELSLVSPMMKKIADVYLLSFVFYFLLQFSELTAARIAVYGRLMEIIIFTRIVYLRRPKLEGTVFLLGLLLLTSFYFVKEVETMKEQSGLIILDKEWVPYISVFTKEEQYYNTYFYYIMHYVGKDPTPRNYHMRE
ncbi:EpsG family protein [Proteiniclasticum ruminis]|uniref:EpsG family protein n=1 Tax=Proteiniclasticum ruminis TaxID=398199 RepID=A0A1G8JQD1_9CLOT|nr:EpsG family protein [Proteiniclasticum ruminis]SDI33428.1 EpsG family protein [Proteiniclasticum ruminis]